MTSQLQENIRQFYDCSSSLWETVWGEHMHHGYYGPGGTHRKDRYQAQIDLIEALLAWGQVQQATHILDVGCGIGGSSLYLANRYQATVTGITLSPKQAQRATERAQAVGLAPLAGQPMSSTVCQVDFRVEDAMATTFPDSSFDVIWSMESGEHMPDKALFLEECYRLLKPGGIFLMATWCHRPTHSLAGPLTNDERQHLESIYQVYHLPYVISLSEYEQLAHQVGLEAIRTADWTEAVIPFWDEVIWSALNPMALAGLFQAGWPALQGALGLGLMRQGFSRGLVRYGLLCGVR